MSITKETAKYIVKNESHADEVISLLKEYGLLGDVGVGLVHTIHQTSEIFSSNQKTVLIFSKKHSDNDIQDILRTHAIDKKPHVVIDEKILDGYVLYHDGKKITVTAQDRISRFVNK